jgi:hypothetical protein
MASSTYPAAFSMDYSNIRTGLFAYVAVLKLVGWVFSGDN